MKDIDELDLIDISPALKPAIYILAVGGVPVYIGQSMKPLQRLGEHINNIKFDSVYIVPCELGEMATLEAEFIRKYKPEYNIKFPRSPVDNLSPKLPQKPVREPRLSRLTWKLRETDIEKLAKLIHEADGTIEDDEEDVA